MTGENEKYNRVIDLLRKSNPSLNSSGEIEREVIKRVSGERSGISVIDFLFGWVYVSWVRRSLIAASVILVLVFVYQQAVILERIDSLSKQTIVIDRSSSASGDGIERLLTSFRNSGRRFPSRTISISESQLNELIESVNALQIKYKDLENLLEGDPDLRKLIEKKLIENDRTKIKL